MSVKALGLVSGGLDSILALLVLRRAGLTVEGITFSTPFFGPEAALRAARLYDFYLQVMEVGEEHLREVVQNPRYGYGQNMNPCIDCHGYMLKKAAAVMTERGFDFIFTGEVVGQRPMSQNRQSLSNVARLSGVPDKILRPLSAKVLPVTVMEEAGLVDREQLCSLNGRGRKGQFELAESLGVTEFPPPGGGCLLTEPNFSRRLQDLLEHDPQCQLPLVEILKLGRHFRLSKQTKLVLGRDQQDNHELKAKFSELGLSLLLADQPGPFGLVMGCAEAQDLSLAASLLAAYAKAGPEKKIAVLAGSGQRLEVEPLSRRLAQKYMV